MTAKDCTRCGVVKPLDEFYKGTGRLGRAPRCKACCREVSANFRLNNPERVQEYRVKRRGRAKEYSRIYKLRHHFDMSLEDFNEKVAQQGGRCDLCRRRPKANRILCIDHDHSCCDGIQTCGKCVRGLLCVSCNSRLGILENAEWVIAAVAYLERWRNARMSSAS